MDNWSEREWLTYAVEKSGQAISQSGSTHAQLIRLTEIVHDQEDQIRALKEMVETLANAIIQISEKPI